MVRPPFPQWYWENHIPEHGPENDVIAIVSSPWKLGDLVDFWYTGCYWTGKIIEILDDGKVKIVCPETPIGEGGCYDVDCKDLRPALDWSLENGWSAPLSQENGKCWYTARLIVQKPDTESTSSDEDSEQFYDGNEEVQSDMLEEVVDSDAKLPANRNDKCCINNQTAGEEEPHKCMNGTSGTPLEVIDAKVKLAADENSGCCMNSQADSPTSPMDNSGQSSQFLTDGQSSPTSFKKLKTSNEHASVYPPDSDGETIIELEQVSNKIRWAQDLLLSTGSAPRHTAPMFWKFSGKKRINKK